jgi:hypothetical protein
MKLDRDGRTLTISGAVLRMSHEVRNQARLALLATGDCERVDEVEQPDGTWTITMVCRDTATADDYEQEWGSRIAAEKALRISTRQIGEAAMVLGLGLGGPLQVPAQFVERDGLRVTAHGMHVCAEHKSDAGRVFVEKHPEHFESVLQEDHEDGTCSITWTCRDDETAARMVGKLTHSLVEAAIMRALEGGHGA